MFGMCVTAIVQPEIKFDGKEWTVGILDEDRVTKTVVMDIDESGKVTDFNIVIHWLLLFYVLFLLLRL